MIAGVPVSGFRLHHQMLGARKVPRSAPVAADTKAKAHQFSYHCRCVQEGVGTEVGIPPEGVPTNRPDYRSGTNLIDKNNCSGGLVNRKN